MIISPPIALLILAALVPALNTWIYFQSDFGTRFIQVAYPLLKVIQFSIPLLYFWKNRKPLLHMPCPSKGQWYFSFTFGLLAACAILIPYIVFIQQSALAQELSQQVQLKVRNLGFDSPKKYMLLGFLIAIVHSGLEEFYWRLFLFKGARTYITLRWAVPLTALAFMLHHMIVIKTYLPSGSYWIHGACAIYVFMGGCLWNFQLEKTQNIFGTWVSHVLIDVALMTIGYDLIWPIFQR